MSEKTLGEVHWDAYIAKMAILSGMGYRDLDSLTRDAIEDGAQAVAAHVASPAAGRPELADAVAEQPWRAAWMAYVDAAGFARRPPVEDDEIDPEWRAAWEAAAQAALRAGSPRCPNGCGCRLGTDDADVRDCGCDGLCCYDEIEIEALFRENRELRAKVAATQPQPAPELAAAMAGCRCGHAQTDHAFSDDVCAVPDCPCDGYAPAAPTTADYDQLRERLGVLRDRIGNLAAGLRLSASSSHPSKKSQIESGVADALLALLDPR